MFYVKFINSYVIVKETGAMVKCALLKPRRNACYV